MTGLQSVLVSSGGEVAIVLAESGAAVLTLGEGGVAAVKHTFAVDSSTCAAIDSANELIAIGRADGTVHVYTAASGSCTQNLRAGSGVRVCVEESCGADLHF